MAAGLYEFADRVALWRRQGIGNNIVPIAGPGSTRVASYTWREGSEGERLGAHIEVMMLSDDGSTLSGRLYGVVHGELGLDDVT